MNPGKNPGGINLEMPRGNHEKLPELTPDGNPGEFLENFMEELIKNSR